MKLQKKESKIITRLDQSNVLDWKVSSILLKTKFIISHIMFKYRCRSSIWFSLSIFELKPIVHDISPLKNIDDVIPIQPEDSPLNIPRYFSFAFNDHTWKFGVNRSRIDWVMNQTIKKEYAFTLQLTPKVNVTFNFTWYFSVFKIDWNCNSVGLLHHPYWLRLVFRHFWGINLQPFCYLLCLAEDHWGGFSTRNAHMVHIVN